MVFDQHQASNTWLPAPPQLPHSSWPPPPPPVLEAERLLRGGLAGERTLDGGGGVYGRFSTSALIFSRRNCTQINKLCAQADLAMAPA